MSVVRRTNQLLQDDESLDDRFFGEDLPEDPHPDDDDRIEDKSRDRRTSSGAQIRQAGYLEEPDFDAVAPPPPKRRRMGFNPFRGYNHP